MSKKNEKGAKMAETVAGLGFTRDGDDLVIRVNGLYATRGVKTETENDTRKLASSPGMFFWVPDDSSVAHPNPENRRLGLKFTAILGKPRDLSAEPKAAKTTSDKPMSAVSLG